MTTVTVLGTIQEAGEALLVLTEDLGEGELLASWPTRSEITRQLGVLAAALRMLPREMVSALPEIDWAGWRGMAAALGQASAAGDEALCFGVRFLVPATVCGLRRFRLSQPEMFAQWA